MKKIRWLFTPELLLRCALSVFIVAALTAVLLLIGRDKLGGAVAALAYLLPVAWSAARWGLWPSLCSALSAVLAFDLFFIPPYYSFTVARLEGWLALVALSVVAIALVASIQSSLSRARASERDGIQMYELGVALTGLRTQDAVLHALAAHLQRTYQARLVEVSLQSCYSPPMIVKAPPDGQASGRPDRVLPILAAPEWIGEVRLWGAAGWLPPEDSYLFRNYGTQAALALERARQAEAETQAAAAAGAAMQ